MTERELLVDCLHRLNGTTITYYLTGSMASNYWGIPRTTHDLDFVIQLPPSGVDEIVSAFSPDYLLFNKRTSTAPTCTSGLNIWAFLLSSMRWEAAG